MPGKLARRQRIRQLLEHQRIFSQEELSNQLKQSGYGVTQATLSRDLRDMGVSKGPGGYQLPGVSPVSPQVPPATRVELERLLKSQLLAASTGGNLVVLRTQPGHANPLALEIDRSQLPQVIGTIAGDDTVFVAARTPAQAGSLLKLFRKMAGQS
jgi:transcriptional regulator of arginine metabolism